MNRFFKNIIALASIISLIICAPIKAEWHWRQLFNIFKNSAQSQLKPIIPTPHTSKDLFPAGAGVFEEESSELDVKKIFSKTIAQGNLLTFKDKKFPQPYFSPYSRKLITGKIVTETIPEEKTQSNQYRGLCDEFRIAKNFTLNSAQAKFEEALKKLKEDNAEAVKVQYSEFGIEVEITRDLKITTRKYTSNYPASTAKRQAFLQYIGECINIVKEQIPFITSTQSSAPVSTTKKSITIRNALNEIISKFLTEKITIRNLDNELQQYINNHEICGIEKFKHLKKEYNPLNLAIAKVWPGLLDKENQARFLDLKTTKGAIFEDIMQIGIIKCLLKFGADATTKDSTYGTPIEYAQQNKQSNVTALLTNNKK